MTARLVALAGEPSTLLYAVGFWLTLIQISIAASHIVLTFVMLLWIYQLSRGKQTFSRLPVDAPVALFVALSVLSAVFSFDPVTSITDTKKLVLFSVPYLVMSTFRKPSTFEKMILLLIVVADVAAAVSLWQYVMGEAGDVNHRLKGFLSHYMTFSGLLMSIAVLAAAELLFRRGHRWLHVASLGLMLTVLLLGLTRSAWLGVVAALTLLVFLRDRRWLLAIPVLVAGLWLAVPPDVEMRLRSFLRPDRSAEDRWYMLQSGVGMVANHPWLGVGPFMVGRVYPVYKAEAAPAADSVHLHNNVAQIAAERGIPCLAAWVWLMASLLVWSVRAYRNSWRGDQRALTGGALGVLVASLVAGMFEYNLGDSEFLMLFLFVMTIPFVVERSREEALVS